MGVKERKEREQEKLRQKILDAASELFAREGYQNVSMRKIARRIEYSPTTIYLYFKDKADLLYQICEETFANLIKEIEKIETTFYEPIICLRKGMRAYIDFGLKYPNHYEVTFIAPLSDYLGEQHSYEGSSGQKAFEHIVQQVSESMKACQIKRGDVNTISQTLWAGIHGVTSLLIAHEDFPFVEKDELIDNTIDTLIKGLQH
ncbi:MAG: TetR/AcrR family transcriptional regulator [Pyrinomonadaceae bacterium]